MCAFWGIPRPLVVYNRAPQTEICETLVVANSMLHQKTVLSKQSVCEVYFTGCHLEILIYAV